jgi:predicted RNA-binding protein with PIN domain
MISYIIDGHNFIHEVPVYLELLDRNYVECQKTLYRQLQDYTQTRKVVVTLLFDGNPSWDPPKDDDNLEVCFSGNNREADDLIISLAEKWKKRSIIVVTRDNGIRNAVTAAGCQTMLPADFHELIKTKHRHPSTHSQIKSKSSLTPKEVKEWKELMQDELVRRQKKGA